MKNFFINYFQRVGWFVGIALMLGVAAFAFYFVDHIHCHIMAVSSQWTLNAVTVTGGTCITWVDWQNLVDHSHRETVIVVVLIFSVIERIIFPPKRRGQDQGNNNQEPLN